MNEEQKIKVYIKLNSANEVTEISSEIFIKDFDGWINIDEGYADKYAHAQGHYLEKSLIDENGNYRYIYNSHYNKIIER